MSDLADFPAISPLTRDGMATIEALVFLADLVRAINELKAQNEALAARIVLLEAEVFP